MGIGDEQNLILINLSKINIKMEVTSIKNENYAHYYSFVNDSKIISFGI